MGMTIKVGLMVLVNATIRELFRRGDRVNVEFWASHESLDRAKSLGAPIAPVRLLLSTQDKVYIINEDGTDRPHEDYLPLGGFAIQGLGLFVLRYLLEENRMTRLQFFLNVLDLRDYFPGDALVPEDYEVVAKAEQDCGYTEVRLLASGNVLVKEDFECLERWDSWTITPDGVVKYTGPTHEAGYRPTWLERAIEKHLAGGV
jgi:hypothetical protein